MSNLTQCEHNMTEDSREGLVLWRDYSPPHRHQRQTLMTRTRCPPRPHSGLSLENTSLTPLKRALCHSSISSFFMPASHFTPCGHHNVHHCLSFSYYYLLLIVLLWSMLQLIFHSLYWLYLALLLLGGCWGTSLRIALLFTIRIN